jgi:hypothetical protein
LRRPARAGGRRLCPGDPATSNGVCRSNYLAKPTTSMEAARLGATTHWRGFAAQSLHMAGCVITDAIRDCHQGATILWSGLGPAIHASFRLTERLAKTRVPGTSPATGSKSAAAGEHLAGLGQAIDALGRPRQRRGYAGQARARRLEIVYCESNKPSCKKIYLDSPCVIARSRRRRSSLDGLGVRTARVCFGALAMRTLGHPRLGSSWPRRKSESSVWV